MKTVIVGGVAGGASAAARLRRLSEKMEIVLFEKGPHISFANCGLPYYIGGVIPDEEDLLLHTPDSFFGRFRVDVRIMSEVVRIDRAGKKVEVRDLKTGDTYTEPYDRLILSPGAAPARPPVNGSDCEGVFTLRSVPDALAIEKFIRDKDARIAAVAGGGNIGIEMAENLRLRGLEVTLLISSPYAMSAALDRELANVVHRELEDNAVRLRLNCDVISIEAKGGSLRVTATDGELDADMVLIGKGVVPDSSLAKDAGLRLGVRGCISVDDRMRTSDPDIYAVGDAVEVTEFVTGRKRHIALAGPANRQGRIAADQIAGIDSRYRGTQGSSITKVFGLTVACTGISELTAKREGLNFDKVYLNVGSHAGYYPGARHILMKVLFEKNSGKILGGQFIGAEGADKRCDVLAAAIRAGMTAQGLTELELCYAPPYSSAKDPVNMAGFAIENIVTGKVNNFHWDRLPEIEGREASRIDVRTAGEFGRGSVPGFVNIPLDELRNRLGEIPEDRPAYVHCQSGLRSYVACRILSGNGYECYNISGGYHMYNMFRDSGIIAE